MYDLELKFETTLFVNVLSKEIQSMFKNTMNSCPEVGTKQTVVHTMTITNVEKIPNSNDIERMREVLHKEYSEHFESRRDINVRVTETKFIGITKITEKHPNLEIKEE